MNPLEQQLRDIHLPAEVGWWPPAPGWWLLAGLLFAVLWLAWRRWRRPAPAQPLLAAAHGELDAIEKRYRAEPQSGRLARELSELLRRVCVLRFPRSDTAGLTGPAWLELLDSVLGTSDFRDGSGQVLAQAPYQANPEVDARALLALARRWLVAVEDRG